MKTNSKGKIQKLPTIHPELETQNYQLITDSKFKRKNSKLKNYQLTSRNEN
ncbi:hypothetical protein [Pedobacter aquae]|uniref:hypothetical protein n=1 Tax=Pedobacter aquae TaxID=2605747 RepID=UPI0019800037|nr:hypothetical protein [Pedobacter aquae]